MSRLIPALLTACCLAACVTPRAAAQATRPTTETGAGLRIYLMTFSPGSIIYERFGHNALVVHDPTPSADRVAQRERFDADFHRRYGGYPKAAPPLLPTDRAHHYGAFDFEQPNFVPRFVMGRMEYWTTSEWADLTALLYAADDRGVLLQELDLSPAQKLALKDFLEWNELPENRTYRYDYYRDNCSTRVRDAIDRATGGLLKQQMAEAPTGTTHRSHTRRLTSGLDPVDLFWFTSFTYVMGHPIDVPLSAWDEAFLPDQFAQHVRGVTLPDASGKAKPLVLSEQWIATTTRTPMPEKAPRRVTGYFVTGVVVGGVFLWLARLSRRHPSSPDTPGEASGNSDRPRAGRGAGAPSVNTRGTPLAQTRSRASRLPSVFARVAFSLLILFWAVLWGIGGSIAAWGWSATDHAASYRNENLLQFSPLILPLAVLGPVLAFGRRRGARLAVALGVLDAGLSAIGLLVKAFPPFWQHNAEIIALALPSHVGLALGLVLLARDARAGVAPSPASADAAHTAEPVSPKKTSKPKAKAPIASE